MSNFHYVAIDSRGSEKRGTLDVDDQTEALRRIKEMGLFPTKILTEMRRPSRSASSPVRSLGRGKGKGSVLRFRWRVRPAHLATFTRQLATLVEAGMPLLRGLRILEQQEESRAFRGVIGALAQSVEDGNSFAEALLPYPRVFNRLYVNMVRAGELGGALEVALKRLAEFMEKAERIKGRVKSALFYPFAVLAVATAILGVLMVFVVPRFKLVFEGLLNGAALPWFTLFMFNVSEAIKHHFVAVSLGIIGMCIVAGLALHTNWGRWTFDRMKLAMPILGPLFRKAAISRFARTLGVLVSNGVPILQALTIVRETAGNVVLGGLVGRVHEQVKQGEPIAPTLRTSGIFPVMVAGMVDVGEQTGALPEMLMKVADTYDEEVDNAATALTSLLEPIMIVFLAVVVGCIVLAMFLPLIKLMEEIGGPTGAERGEA